MKKFQSSHHLLLFFFCHLCILTIFMEKFTSCGCPEHQKAALLNIFSNRSALPSWRDDGSSFIDCCQWEGITCDHVSGEVIGLDVTDHSISATINSSALSSLRSLRFLNLSYNDFGFTAIPSDLDSLSNLTHLNLSHSHFNGQIPAAIGRMNNLVIVDLSSDYSDYLKLEEPGAEVLLRKLSKLTKLHLDGVNISAQVPQFLSNFTCLTSLILSHCNLIGEFPATIFRMPNLEILDASWNPQLNGSFPEFPRENDLRILDLSGTGFSGSLPNSFHNLSNLTELHLNDCNFSSQLPPSLLSLTRLLVIELRHNNFSGKIPSLDSSKSVGYQSGLRHLEILDLGGNLLHGTIPSYLFTLPSLKKLYLDGNRLKGELPEFTNASSTLEMVWLDLSNNEITGEIPSWLWTVGGGNLRHLNLSGNSLTSLQQPCNLSSTSSLEVVDLHSNRLRGELPLPPSSIRTLDCSRNDFTSTLSSELASRLVHALFFSISGNYISGEIPSSICNASSLRVLDLSDNNLRGSIPNCFSNLTGLNTLNLEENRLTGTIPNISSNQRCHLQVLNLKENQLEGKLPKALSNCKDLLLLNVANNRLSGPFSSHPDVLFNLQILILRSNNFSGSLTKLCSASAPVLRIIDMSFNSFSDTLPADCFRGFDALTSVGGDEDSRDPQGEAFKHVAAVGAYYQVTMRRNGKRVESGPMILTILDLSNNKLEGEIPKQIGDLKSLMVLNMSYNYLKGQIPTSMGSLRQLEAMDLSQNQLSGRIPLEMTKLYFLSSLDLSYNQLVGSIPMGSQFSTFSSEPYIGNPELCGEPLDRRCEKKGMVVLVLDQVL